MHRILLLGLLGAARLALADYSLAHDYLYGDFFDHWDFFTDADPTNGYVNYVDRSTASSNGYISQSDEGFIYLGVDYTNVASGRGRDSVRLSSKPTYTHYLTVIDVGHMPGGICGTWPAFWSFGNGGGWPNDGEIDIIEGANEQQTNYMSLHTSAGCENSASHSLVEAASTNCDAKANDNQGCTFHDSSANTYGSQFNAQEGGTYAAEWTSDGVNMWFWPRGGAPDDALGDNPDPSGWGNPRGSWGGSGCDWESKFQEHNLVFDTTFCGSWAGAAFDSCSAANNGQTCNDFVKNNPEAFRDAYWEVRALKVYQQGGSRNSHRPSASTTPDSYSLSETIPIPTSTFATSSISTIRQSSDGLVIPDASSEAAASSSASFLQEESGGIFIPKHTASAHKSAFTAEPSATALDPENLLRLESDGGVFIPKQTSSADSPAPAKPAQSKFPHKKPANLQSDSKASSSDNTSTQCAENKATPTNKIVFEEEDDDGDVYRPGKWYARKHRAVRS